MSVLVIEGVTASGKTTLVNRLLEKHPEWKLAPEPTPPPVEEGQDLLERQGKIFQSFMDHCLKLINADETYLLDYSPAGCVAFSLALAKYENNDDYLGQAAMFNDVCQKYDWHIIAFLDPTPEEVKTRLRRRARRGDDAWDPLFLEILCDEYKKYFKDIPVSEVYKDEIAKLREEIDREKVLKHMHDKLD
ncbi:MAG: deoxynucleoside kinase [Paludibacteraceae bacterium]|nr:deoxynucleoside kinase [Paludibacteraceae bacterium]